MTPCIDPPYFVTPNVAGSSSVPLSSTSTTIVDASNQLAELLLDYLTPCFSQYFKQVFGDEYETIISIKQPWTAVDLILLLDKHWISVFGDIYPSKYHNKVKILARLAKYLWGGKMNSNSRSQLKEFGGACEFVFDIVDRTKSRKEGDEARAKLKTIISTL